ncbi:methyl-accepting chemotaxis protein [Neptuniibacter sp. 1_MG-2023]|uniref:methyl-accepting chemotaxis protein n=1 Tax=Neptuniibacter sp. 1_MG-2023 TaxID=3062662 RepID=UPI0026E2D06E|nr:methyl-accepting chemotaxis protein [Neptuniibacter sp. 1_MG-2023]MDO6592213.1 methyl-accepting chemotaxis protein [Neptuniibacter sp. 1_MG-2023]
MSLYKSIERTLFNSLTKKIVGNVLFLIIPNIILMVLVYRHTQSVESILLSAEVGDSTKQLLGDALGVFWLSASVTVGLALAGGIFTIFFMRHLFLKPIQDITRVLSAIKEKGGDISVTLPVYTCDEISVMAQSYNEFSSKLKDIIADTRSRSVNIAVSAARLKKVIGQASNNASDQEDKAHQVFQSSSESTQAIDEIARSTIQISEQNSSNLNDVRGSSSELLKVQEQVEAIHQLVSEFQTKIASLHANSQNITQILLMVQEFSEQTNLLALNASIEAARAGDAGRGFAVVADEVRGLAQKVGSATSEIDKNISQMSSLVSDTGSSAKNILGYVESTGQFIEQTNIQFGQLVTDFEQVDGQLSGISAAIDELSYTNKSSHKQVDLITKISAEIKQEMEHSQSFSNDLEVSTEESQELLSRFIIGYGAFESIIVKGRGFHSELQGLLEELGQRCNIFDTNYQRVNPDQQPAKFVTSCTDKFDGCFQAVIDRFIELNSEFIYTVLVDQRGYIATHHKKVSKPMTGDFSIDNLQSRNRRIFFDTRSEQRRATHTQPFLMQTYIRDTGEILNELSIPVFVGGRHWGALIMGFNPDVLL